MNRKSFFWPVLSEEEERRKKEQERGGQPVMPSGPSGQTVSVPADPSPAPTEPALTPREEMSPSDHVDEQAAKQAPAETPYPSGLPVMPSVATAADQQQQPAELAPNPYDLQYEPDMPDTQPVDPDILLALVDVHRSYEQADKHLVVLDGADLQVRAGEMVALVAPSGAGKSTLLHIAGLLEQPTSGEVFIAGEPQGQAVDRARTLMRRNEIGFVYQFHHLLAEFSALENVTLPQLIRGEKPSEAKAKALELLSYMKVDHRAQHRPAELSGGEQQRVAIARAMANAPRVLLADEPTGNLDPNTSEYVFKALNSLVKQSGIAALVATHNLFLAERMDRQITIVDGKIVEL